MATDGERLMEDGRVMETDGRAMETDGWVNKESDIEEGMGLTELCARL